MSQQLPDLDASSVPEVEERDVEDVEPRDSPPFPGQHSLPSVEEARNDAAFRGIPTKNKKFWLLVGTSALALVIIIALSVGISARNATPSAASAPPTGNDQGFSTPRSPDRLREVKDFLSRFSSRDSLDTPGTPQYRAAEWIANTDGRQVDIPETTAYDDSYGFVQRYVLAVFYYQLNGEAWTYDQMRFLSDSDECDWSFGLKANERPPGGGTDEWYMGVDCNDDDEVNYIFLPANNLVGELPAELNLLEGMEHFSVFANEISGSLPDLSGWQDLNFFAAESNMLSGPLGAWFNFPNLEYLALGDNKFTGNLPSFAWATNLKQVALDSNGFTGPVDVFNAATQLESLFLQNNAFTGPVDNTVFADLSLVELDMSNNLITGSFPEQFYTFEIVDLHNNSFSGEMPEVMFAGYPLRFLSVYENGFSGDVPDSIGFLDDLTHLDLSYNGFTGFLTDVFNQLVNLEYLFLHRNNFESGPIPNLHHLVNLKELSLKGTNLIEGIPEWMGSLTELVLLDLHDNALEGVLPESLGDLENLRFLFLNRNQLSGVIPSTYSDMESLSMFVIDGNDLTGDDSAICGDNQPSSLAYMVGDCDELTCACCTKCCYSNAPDCNRMELSSNIDGGYVRDQYVFSEDLKFTAVYGEPDN